MKVGKIKELWLLRGKGDGGRVTAVSGINSLVPGARRSHREWVLAQLQLAESAPHGDRAPLHL